MRSNTILFTGLIRNEKIFLDKLTILQKLKDEGLVNKIIFSTWIGEISKYRIIFNKLLELDCIIIESKEPNLIIPGHVFHQMKTLFLGLQSCTEKEHVYKMRPDIGNINLAKIKNILEGKYDPNIDIRNGWPLIFEEKVVIEGGFLLYPFYMGDVQFYGKKNDLLKLVNFDLSYEIFFNDLSAEQFFYAKPFLNTFPIFKEYFTANQRISPSDAIGNHKYIEYIKDSNYIYLVLASYFIILKRYFHIESIKTNSELTFTMLLEGNHDQLTKTKDNVLGFNGLSWIESLFIATKHSNQNDKIFMNILQKVDDINFHKEYVYNILNDSEDLKKYKNYLENYFNNNHILRNLNKTNNPNIYIMMNSDLRIKKYSESERITELNEEINLLRREINRLRNLINKQSYKE